VSEMSLPRSPTLVAVAEHPTHKICVGIRFSPANAMYSIGISQRVTFSARILRPADIESILLHMHSRASQ
jgi:hypothetical protein